MKKVIACILTLVMLLTLGVPAFASDKQGTDIPNIYLQGQGRTIYMPDKKTIAYESHKVVPEGFIGQAVQECMPSFLEALRADTQEAWDAYRAKFFDVVMPIFKPFFLNKDGEVENGTDILRDWENDPPVKYADGSYTIRSNNFFQDWRLDPFANAASLNSYINKVKADTGKDKVNLVARCEGVNVVLAYFAEYGYDDVNCLEMYVQSASGVELIDALFSGNMEFDAASITRFKNLGDTFTIEDEMLNELLDAVLSFANSTFLLEIGMSGLEMLAPKLYKEVIVYLLRRTYGTFPGIWSLIDAENYQAARKGVFGGYEEEYAGLLEKLDDYDVRVRQRVNDIILDAVAHGVKVANYAKYGNYQLPPLTPENDEINDNSVALKAESLGATTAKIGKTLTDKYIEDARKAGTDKYISPDKMVDASTCLLPDTTWFIYGSDHTSFPIIIHDFMLKFLKKNGDLTVFDETAPQYMFYEGEEDNNDTMAPMTAQNAPEKMDSGSVTFKQVNWKEMLQRLWNAILAFIKNLIANRAG